MRRGKLLNSTWTFRGSEVVVQNAQGQHMRSALSFDPTGQRPAFQMTPTGQRPFWVIWARQGDEPWVAWVLTLVPARPAPASPGPCEVLRMAGVERLLGGPTLARPAQDRASAPGSSCELDRTDGSSAVALTIVASPGGSGYVEGARQEARANRKMQIEDEPALGAGAFSAAKGWTVIVVALKGATAMVLRIGALNPDRAELRRFAQRVLDAL